MGMKYEKEGFHNGFSTGEILFVKYAREKSAYNLISFELCFLKQINIYPLIIKIEKNLY